MELPRRINELIGSMAIAKNVIENQQGELREYCVDSTYPLENRWELWREYAEKEHLPGMLHLSVVDIRALIKSSRKKNQTIVHDELLTFVEPHTEIITKVKEELINKNIGSFEYTW